MLKDYIYEFSEKNRTGTDIPVYSVTNTRGFCKGFFDKEVASSDRSSYKIVPYGFFAYNPSRINVGSIAWQDKEEKAIVSPLYVVFGIDEKKVGQDYLMYYLKSPAVNHRINVLATGTIRKNLKLPVLGEFPFNAPSLDEQKKIVAELDLLSGVIEKQKTELKELGNLAQSTFYGMFGDPIENPKGWEIKNLGDVCFPKSIIGRASKAFGSSEEIFYIDIASIDNKKNSITSYTQIVMSEAPSRAQQCVKKNDILISLVRPNLRNVAIVADDKENLVASSGFCVLRADREVLPQYVFRFVCSEEFTNYLVSLTTGANYPAVREDDVRNARIPVPPLALQQSFADKIASIEKQKAALTQSIAETQKLLDYTMDKYFG